MRVYICSPFTDGGRASPEERQENLELAKEYCRRAVEMGYAPLAPHLHRPTFLSEEKDAELWMELDLAWLRVSDEVWVCGPYVSANMQIEVCEAAKHNIPMQRMWSGYSDEQCLLPGG